MAEGYSGSPAIPDNSALLLLLCCVQYQKPSWHVIHHKMASATLHKLLPGSFCRPIHAVAKVLHSKRSWLSQGDTDRGYPLAFATPTLCSLHGYCTKGWQAQGRQDLFLLGHRTIPSTETFHAVRDLTRKMQIKNSSFQLLAQTHRCRTFPHGVTGYFCDFGLSPIAVLLQR